MKSVFTFLLDWALASVWPKILSVILTFWEKMKRAKSQEKAQEKLEEDIKEEKPRTEEVIKNEEDWLNS